ncbi:MAG: amidohydrolase family protein [Ignavibacteriales bacterium]|nr:amidohydrolase family protein [Ignavibacteriales bacterium]
MAQKLFKNGIIFTADSKNTFVECVVTEGNKILYSGELAGSTKYLSNNYETHDLNGSLMLPGLTDNHVHFVSGGFYLSGLDLRPAKSTEEFEQMLKNYIKNKKPGEWITGGDWDHEAWEIKELPTKEMIDKISPDNPVLIHRFDGHLALANSVALKMAEVTASTPEPAGGDIVTDKITGEPTGVLKDNAIDLVAKLIPVSSKQAYIEAVELALKEAARLGVTMVHDITYSNDLSTYQKFEKRGNLHVGSTVVSQFRKYEIILYWELKVDLEVISLKLVL